MPIFPRARILGSLLALSLWAGVVQAASSPTPTPYVAQVVSAEAVVRCKPSTKTEMYPTNRLPQGARVLVLQELPDGWLGIQPPHGSFSWVNATQIERVVATQANWVVKTDNVSVLIGSELVRERPSVEGVRLSRGTQVRVIGQPEKDGTTVWLPIDPPLGEIRYVRAESIRGMPAQTVQAAPAALVPATTMSAVGPQAIPVQGYSAVRTVASPNPVSQTTALAIPAQTAALSPNATAWDEATALEQQGRYEDAIGVYDQLARELQRTNYPWANYAAQRASYLRNGGRAPSNLASNQQPAGYSTFQPEVRVVAPVVQPVAQSVKLSAPAEASTTGQTASWSSPQPGAAPAAALQSYGPGRLVRSAWKVNGAPVYRLEILGNFMYVIAGPGIDLEPGVDRNITVNGTVQYSPDIRQNCVIVKSAQSM